MMREDKLCPMLQKFNSATESKEFAWDKEHKKSVETTIAVLGVTLSNVAYRLNVRPLLRLACSSIVGSAAGFTYMLVHCIPSVELCSNNSIIQKMYQGVAWESVGKYAAMTDIAWCISRELFGTEVFNVDPWGQG